MASSFEKGGRKRGGRAGRDVVWGSAILFLVLFCLLVTPAYASDYYVDAVNGNDETGDGTHGNPWRKLQFAIDSITGTAENPHTIHLAPGHYGPGGSGDQLGIYMHSYCQIIGLGVNTSLDFLRIGSVHAYSAHHTTVCNIKTRYIKT